MKCPYCGHLGDKVVDSRESREGEVIRRRRECLECGRRFTSYERVDEIPYMVVKKDGRRERFERQKLIAGLLRACEKRPVSVAALEAIVPVGFSSCAYSQVPCGSSENPKGIPKHSPGLARSAYPGE